MRKLHDTTRGLLLSVVDFFYPLFRRIMPLQTYRYAACGGFNTLLDISLFFVLYNFVLQKQDLHFLFLGLPVTVGAHIEALLISFSITFPTGFYLSRYVVFQETSAAKRTQLRKYFTVVLGCLMLNYGFMKLFVNVFHWYPTPSKIVTTFFVVAFSYLTQKNYTFKVAEER